nr:lyase family protein [Nocardioides convexus]
MRRCSTSARRCAGSGRRWARLAEVAHARAAEDVTSPMPGYTHLQAAQVITPGFYLSAVAEQVVQVSERLLSTHDRLNRSPLGAGPMSGQEPGLGPRPAGPRRGLHRAGAACPGRRRLAPVAAGRRRGPRRCGRRAQPVPDRPDVVVLQRARPGRVRRTSLAGISAAMPQKKNYPVLERLRGRTAHLLAFHVDIATGQRNTAFSNSVEVSKEAGLHAATLFAETRSVLAGTTLVLDRLHWRVDRMRAACAGDHFGGLTLANESHSPRGGAVAHRSGPRRALRRCGARRGSGPRRPGLAGLRRRGGGLPARRPGVVPQREPGRRRTGAGEGLCRVDPPRRGHRSAGRAARTTRRAGGGVGRTPGLGHGRGRGHRRRARHDPRGPGVGRVTRQVVPVAPRPERTGRASAVRLGLRHLR